MQITGKSVAYIYSAEFGNKFNNTNKTNSFNNELAKKDYVDKKLIKENIIDFIDKNGGFSSVSKENEELFRAILSDDKISTAESKSMSYEQAKEFDNLLSSTNRNSTEGSIHIDFSDIFGLADISYDEDFNKALYETLKNIDDDTERFLFSSDMTGKLGYYSKRLGFEGTIEENIQADIAREKEKYKDFDNKDQILAGIIQDIKNWKITDYGSFTKNLTNEYKSLSEHPLLSSESKLKYKKYSEYTTNMEINYNKAKNQTRYI